MTASWRPLLDGELAEAAWAAVRAIGDDLATRPRVGRNPIDQALFCAHAAAALDDDENRDRYDAALGRVEDHVAAGLPSASLYDGIVGAAWTIHHLTGDDCEEFLLDVDEQLTAMVADRGSWTGHYDLISGLVGLGVYFLERAPRPGARRGLHAVIDVLDELGSRRGGVMSWHTPVDHVPHHQRAQFPNGYENCGLAHGVPGVIALMGRAASAPDPHPRASAIARAADRWIMQQHLSSEPRGQFPAWVAPGFAPRPTRTAWCYGDAGVLAALWSARRRLGDPLDTVVDMALACVGRPVHLCGVEDAGLCHGAAGLGHIYNRFYQASDDERFGAAARDWFARALAMRTPGAGVGGFRVIATAADGSPIPRDDGDFLEGAAGIGLALLAALGRDPAWDRLLACDIPTAAEPP